MRVTFLDGWYLGYEWWCLFLCFSYQYLYNYYLRNEISRTNAWPPCLLRSRIVHFVIWTTQGSPNTKQFEILTFNYIKPSSIQLYCSKLFGNAPWISILITALHGRPVLLCWHWYSVDGSSQVTCWLMYLQPITECISVVVQPINVLFDQQNHLRVKIWFAGWSGWVGTDERIQLEMRNQNMCDQQFFLGYFWLFCRARWKKLS